MFSAYLLKPLSQGSIYWKIPPGEREFQLMSFVDKKYEKGEEKRGEMAREKGRKWKEGEKMGSRRGKWEVKGENGK